MVPVVLSLRSAGRPGGSASMRNPSAPLNSLTLSCARSATLDQPYGLGMMKLVTGRRCTWAVASDMTPSSSTDCSKTATTSTLVFDSRSAVAAMFSSSLACASATARPTRCTKSPNATAPRPSCAVGPAGAAGTTTAPAGTTFSFGFIACLAATRPNAGQMVKGFSRRNLPSGSPTNVSCGVCVGGMRETMLSWNRR